LGEAEATSADHLDYGAHDDHLDVDHFDHVHYAGSHHHLGSVR
jgi:hypothetical protein